MDPNTNEYEQDGTPSAVWIGIAIGAAIGLAYAASTYKKKSRWSYRNLSKKVAESGEELADSGRNILERLQIIIEEGRKVIEEASELWEHGRKLVRR